MSTHPFQITPNSHILFIREYLGGISNIIAISVTVPELLGREVAFLDLAWNSAYFDISQYFTNGRLWGAKITPTGVVEGAEHDGTIQNPIR